MKNKIELGKKEGKDGGTGHDMTYVAKVTGYCARYLRRLCHQQAVEHHRLRGKYYMTDYEISLLIKPTKVMPAK